MEGRIEARCESFHARVCGGIGVQDGPVRGSPARQTVSNCSDLPALNTVGGALEEDGIFANLLAVLTNLGLEIARRPMEFEALRRYMRVRWRYFDVDVPHRDILATDCSPE